MKNAPAVLDASALLAFLAKEKGYELVRTALAGAAESDTRLLMNEINLGEVYYVLSRERTEDAARFFFAERLPLLPIAPLANDMDTVVGAARLEARLGLPYIDAFAAVTARVHGAPLLTADRDFRKAAGEVDVRWVR